MKECELRLQAEVTVREQLTQDVVQFRALVDSLTSVSTSRYVYVIVLICEVIWEK